MADTSFSLVELGKFAEPVSKLIEALRDTAGILYEPTRIRRRALAEAESLVVLANANADVAEIEARAKQRVQQLESRRQENIESIVDRAIQELTDSYSTEPLNSDWLVHFLMSAQDTGDTTVQNLWGRILAGEIESPGRYSKRLVEFVKLLSRQEAESISEYCRHVWKVGNDSSGFAEVFLCSDLIHRNAPSQRSAPFLPLSLRLKMRNLGVAEVQSDLAIRVKREEQNYFWIQNNCYVADKPEFIGFDLEADILSDLGHQLLQLCSDVSLPMDYVDACVKQYQLRPVNPSQ